MLTRTATTIFAALLLAQFTYRDDAGRVIGNERTDSNGVTTFSDSVGRTVGRARTDQNGVTFFYDAAGRIKGVRRGRQ